MRVDEVFKQAASQGTTPVSFEMFPPKGELTLDTAREVAGNLMGTMGVATCDKEMQTGFASLHKQYCTFAYSGSSDPDSS